MGMLRDTLKQAKLNLYESIFTRKRRIALDRPVFSFTFDDAPRSAATVGRKILEDAGAAGTYYLALGIQADPSDTEPFVSVDEIRSLYAAGHDIECHTYSHINLARTPVHTAAADCEKNRQAISDVTGQQAVAHFAYPFGGVGLKAKHRLGQVYRTMRTVDFGINYGMTDMLHLRAVDIFSCQFDRQRISEVIETAQQNNAWTIFYTHEVTDNPSQWGTRSEELDWVVRECAGTSGAILTVNQASELIESKGSSA